MTNSTNPPTSGLRTSGTDRRLRSWTWTAVLLWVLVAGCSGSAPPERVVLLKVGRTAATVDDFHRAFDLMKAGLREMDSEDPEAERDAKIHLLKQLSEEMALLEKARDAGIVLAPDDLTKAVADIKSDYPDDTFEQVLIENAVPYAAWEEELEKRLIIEKLLDREVYSRVKITEEELAALYQSAGTGPTGKKTPADKSREAVLVEQLRRRKAEDRLDRLMDEIRKAYPAELNEAAFQEILSP
ncbi:MAG: SurA N-terminal domain-containing protein [Desulfobacterales bacterium]